MTRRLSVRCITSRGSGFESNFDSIPVYVEGKKHPKAIVAYERALMWRELFTLALEDGVDESEIEQIAIRVAGG